MKKTSTTLTAGRPSARNRTRTLASLTNREERKRVNFDLSAEQHQKLKIYAASQRKTVRQLFTDYVDALPRQ